MMDSSSLNQPSQNRLEAGWDSMSNDEGASTLHSVSDIDDTPKVIPLLPNNLLVREIPKLAYKAIW